MCAGCAPNVTRTLAVAGRVAHPRAMGYPPRIQVPAHWYHVMSNGVDGFDVFVDEVDRAAFLALVGRELRRSEWTCAAYSLMSTHFHVLIQLDKPTLSSGMQHLKSDYTRLFNRRHGRRGTIWQRRFHDVLVETDSHLLEVNRYIALNAPRAGMCEAPEDHPWCSYGAAVGDYPADPLVAEDEVLGLFSTTPYVGRRRLREFVEEADPRRRRSLAPI